METQKRNNNTKKEPLSMMETLKEFRTILLGNNITVYTAHSNLTHKSTEHDCYCVLHLVLLI